MIARTAVLLGITMALASGGTARALSPPWYSLQRQLAATIGTSPCVTVSDVYDIGETHYIDVQACTPAKAKALSFILIRDHSAAFNTFVRVLDPTGNVVKPPPISGPPGQFFSPQVFIIQQFKTALRGSPLYVRTFAGYPSGRVRIVWCEVAKEVVQYWNDDIGDFYGNTNDVAANVFASVCRSRYKQNGVIIARISWTTTNAGSASPSMLPGRRSSDWEKESRCVCPP